MSVTDFTAPGLAPNSSFTFAARDKDVAGKVLATINQVKAVTQTAGGLAGADCAQTRHPEYESG